MRIVSFLPSATEMVCALGLEDHLVGITHECDYPPRIKGKPVVVRSAIEMQDLPPHEIDEAVTRQLQSGRSVYRVEERLLQELAPDLILTQDLCQVCAPSGNEVSRALQLLPTEPKIVWLAPTCLGEILQNLIQIGEATGKAEEARDLVSRLQERVKRVVQASRVLGQRPRTFCMEWLDPPYCAGHWMPELVEMAGGLDGLGRKGRDSARVSWEAICAFAPEILILTPCGYHLEGVLKQAHLLTRYPGWEQLPAVRDGRLYAVDANSYFARPGPRVVEGLELLAHLLHPETFVWHGPAHSFRQLSRADLS